MAGIPAPAANIGPQGRRRRLRLGLVAAFIGLVALAVLAVGGAPRGFRLVVFAPFWFAALGVLQARRHT